MFWLLTKPLFKTKAVRNCVLRFCASLVFTEGGLISGSYLVITWCLPECTLLKCFWPMYFIISAVVEANADIVEHFIIYDQWWIYPLLLSKQRSVMLPSLYLLSVMELCTIPRLTREHSEVSPWSYIVLPGKLEVQYQSQKGFLAHSWSCAGLAPGLLPCIRFVIVLDLAHLFLW